MERDPPNYFSGPYIERRAEERENPEWLAEARADPATRYLISQGTTQLLQGGAEPHIALQRNDSPLLAVVEPGSEVLLGWFQGARCVLAELPLADWLRVTVTPLQAHPNDPVRCKVNGKSAS